MIEPAITLIANDNWLEFTIHYVADYKRRRKTKDILFTRVNDTEGHARGDRLLQAVSETIVQSIRKLVKALDIMTSQSGWQVTASVGVVTCTEICDIV